MNFKESLFYNNKFIFKKSRKLDDNTIKLDIPEIIDLNNYNIDEIFILLKCPLIDYIKQKYNIIVLTYDIFIEKLDDLFGNFIRCISVDEDDNYILVNKNIISIDNPDKNLIDFTTTVYQKLPFKKIFSFMTPQLTNNNTMVYLKNLDHNKFKKLYIKNIIEGINCFLIYNNYWQLISEKSINANENVYKNNTINDQFKEIINEKKINLEELDKTKIYNFILVHHKNNGILNFCHYGSGYKELFLNLVLNNKDNLQYVNIFPNIEHKKNNIKLINKLTFENVQELVENINNLSYENIVNKKISIEGYNIYELNKDIQIVNYKLQTHIFQQIQNIKPKNKNIHQGYLEMYQENKLKEYLPYLTNYHIEIIHRISMSLRTISKEFLDIYHYLKKYKQYELYNAIPTNYKKILYGIHGIYIDARKNEFSKNYVEDENKLDTRSITIHDIYHYLKSTPVNLLRQLYFDRDAIIKEKKINPEIYKLFIKDCIYTIIQTKLMSI